MRPLIFLLIVFMNEPFSGKSQGNEITIAVPFLRIAPDARAAGMGDAGLALNADATSIFWNTAKVSLSHKQFDIGGSFTSWLHNSGENVVLESVTGFVRIGEQHGIAFALRRFNSGNLSFLTSTEDNYSGFLESDYCFDAGYSIKLAKYLAAGINLGFVHSNLVKAQPSEYSMIKTGRALKGDISFFYHHPMNFLRKKKSGYNIGVTISNIGNKVSYPGNLVRENFLPANLGLAGEITFRFSEHHRLNFNLDFNKLLVPSPDTSLNYQSESVAQGIFSSFKDAPGGFNEEVREVTMSCGTEYSYRDIFFLRGGFFSESKTMGGLQYLTGGFGIGYRVFSLNFSYLFSTASVKTALDNTMRISVNFYFDKKGRQQRYINATECPEW
ncbi:MAG TPA: type IX secretion system outer membrane channel protein PorV [Chitinophagales bacterium]|nr:type IX secretion system outer membrane channel protein PorV [Chitinophagales bacterium]